MANKLPHVCNYPSCGALTIDRFCFEHTKLTKQKYNKERGSSNNRGYGGDWPEVRKAYLNHYPLCERCEIIGKIIPAVMVHHKIPLDQGGERLNFSNLEALCRECHTKDSEHKRTRWRPREAM